MEIYAELLSRQAVPFLRWRRTKTRPAKQNTDQLDRRRITGGNSQYSPEGRSR
jgi:hypothetical protein